MPPGTRLSRTRQDPSEPQHRDQPGHQHPQHRQLQAPGAARALAPSTEPGRTSPAHPCTPARQRAALCPAAVGWTPPSPAVGHPQSQLCTRGPGAQWSRGPG